MTKFLYAYHGGGKMPETPEDGQEMMKQWMDWATNLGDSMVELGNPVGMSKTITATGVEDNGGSNPLMGYSILQADSMDDVIALGTNCPHLAIGTIEVAEIKEM